MAAAWHIAASISMAAAYRSAMAWHQWHQHGSGWHGRKHRSHGMAKAAARRKNGSVSAAAYGGGIM